MKKAVSIYVHVIKDLIKERQFVVYVHPVPPALDVTRPIVIAYNQILKAAVLNAADLKQYKGKLYWLDFFDDLLTPSGERLKQGIKFDDTHLSPSYIQYLQEALLKLESA